MRPGGQEGHGNSVRTTGCRTTGLAQGFGGIHVAIHPMKFIEDVIDELRCIAGPGCGCWKNSIWFDELMCIAGALAAIATSVLSVNPLS